MDYGSERRFRFPRRRESIRRIGDQTTNGVTGKTMWVEFKRVKGLMAATSTRHSREGGNLQGELETEHWTKDR